MRMPEDDRADLNSPFIVWEYSPFLDGWLPRGAASLAAARLVRSDLRAAGIVAVVTAKPGAALR